MLHSCTPPLPFHTFYLVCPMASKENNSVSPCEYCTIFIFVSTGACTGALKSFSLFLFFFNFVAVVCACVCICTSLVFLLHKWPFLVQSKKKMSCLYFIFIFVKGRRLFFFFVIEEQAFSLFRSVNCACASVLLC